MCSGREAVAIGSAWARALQPGADPVSLAAELRAAAEAAPEGIRRDFDVVVGAQLPLLEVLARVKASGNMANLTTDPAFQTSIQSLASPQVAIATGNINGWFAKNCPPPG